jgi:hypothetical protein
MMPNYSPLGHKNFWNKAGKWKKEWMEESEGFRISWANRLECHKNAWASHQMPLSSSAKKGVPAHSPTNMNVKGGWMDGWL